MVLLLAVIARYSFLSGAASGNNGEASNLEASVERLWPSNATESTFEECMALYS